MEGFCQCFHVLLFCEVKSLPRRYLLQRFYAVTATAVREQKPFESGLGAARTAHH